MPSTGHAQYSVGELESKIYDNVHHNSKAESKCTFPGS